ncbi:MAG TPA: ATP-binding protein [Kofleriaceae bacterium]|nr:ATP-binding protein [Kofleriaceae bacterium]
MSRATSYQLDLGAKYGTWEWDLATDESTWSDELYAILALSPETALPGQAAYATALHPDDLARVVVALDRVRRDGARVELEHRVRTATKSIKLVRLRAWRSTDGRRCHVLVEDAALHSPITDRLASVSAFAAGVAHEINNPLGYLSANLELIGAELDDADHQTLLRDARHGIQRIHTVVRGLMTFSRIEPTHREPLDLNRVLEVAIGIAHGEIRARARLVRNFKPLPLVDANAAQLGQVFINLLLNAAQAIPPGALTDHEITVATHTDAANNAVVEIRDSGRGIPRGIAGKVFEAFVTTKPAGAGPGLGLSVARNLVHVAGGDIHFESEPGRTVFRVVLPASECVPAATAPPELAAVASDRRGRVLVVDDEEIFASSLRRLLARAHEVDVAHDGKEAFARIAAGERYDAIVSDLMMPGMGGVELFTRVSAVSVEQAHRFIFVSAGSPGASEFLARITNPWFDKPCDLDALQAAIRRLVG